MGSGGQHGIDWEGEFKIEKDLNASFSTHMGHQANFTGLVVMI